MIIIGIVLLVLGLALFVLAWRGRIIARGQFCRKCKFDLAGLDIESAQAKCPECGREIHQETARRSSLRRRSRVGFVAAGFAMLAGGASILVGATGKTGSFVAVMPDPIVLWLTDLGMDEALDELVVRVSNVPSMMSPEGWDHAIESGLAHQADTTLAWDVRWGEVLLQSCNNGSMSNKQVTQYLLNGTIFTPKIRNKVSEDELEAAYMLTFKSGRINSLVSGTLPFARTVGISKRGIVRSESDEDLLQGRPISNRGFYIGTGITSSTTSYFQRIKIDEQDGEALVGDEIMLYFEYEIMIQSLNSEEIVHSEIKRVEQAVTVVGRNEPLIEFIDQTKALPPIEDRISVSQIRVLNPFPDEIPSNWSPVLGMPTQTLQLNHAVSMRAFLRLEDGQEIEFGTWVSTPSPQKTMGGSIEWTMDPEDDELIGQARMTCEYLREQEAVDIILRTDSSLAMLNPHIDKVFDLNLIFHDVPIELADDVSRIWSSSADKWIKGKPMDDEPETAEPVQSP